MSESFRVWHESGDFIAEYDSRDDAQARVESERETCGCEPDEECGVNHPHGFFYDVTDGDYIIEHGQS